MNDVMPVDVTEKDILQAVRESAMLADVSIGVWQGRMSDPRLMEELKQRHGARGNAGTVHKNLLTGADELLLKTKNAFMAVRAMHYKMTIPWVNNPNADRKEGPRLLPHVLNDKYMKEMSRLKRVAFDQLDEFLAAYPQSVQIALSNMGTMVTPDSYPSVERLRECFSIHFDFEPLPEGSGFHGLSDFMLERLTKGLHKRQQRQVAEATREIWQRAAEPIKKLIERLTEDPATTGSDDKKPKKFKDATVENVRKVLEFLPGWNVMGDPQTDEIIEDIRTMLDGLDPAQLRKDDKLREATLKEARRVQDKLAAWGM